MMRSTPSFRARSAAACELDPQSAVMMMLAPALASSSTMEGVSVIVGEDGYALTLLAGRHEPFDGPRYILEQLRIVGVTTDAGQEVFAQCGLPEAAGKHHLDHRRVHVADMFEEVAWRAGRRPPDVFEPAPLAHMFVCGDDTRPHVTSRGT